MAKTKKFGYVEPVDYFPPEIRKLFEEEEEAKKSNSLKKANTQDLEKMMAKKATKKK